LQYYKRNWAILEIIKTLMKRNANIGGNADKEWYAELRGTTGDQKDNKKETDKNKRDSDYEDH